MLSLFAEPLDMFCIEPALSLGTLRASTYAMLFSVTSFVAWSDCVSL